MYFGEWHTHPQEDPFPSQRDIRNWKNLMKKSNTETKILLFIIAGIDIYKIWIGDRERMEIYQVFRGDYNGIIKIS
jgi:integrative and conjugative element protein (TIGR02256 family)